MNLPYTLVEKSVLRKPNSEKSIGTVLTDTIAWMNSLEEGNSVANFFYYAEVIDSDTKDRYFVYSDEAVAYFGLVDNIVEADSSAANGSNGNTISVSETPGYSEDEVLTERRWIDGKPIYRKVIDCGQLPNNTTKSIAHNISDFNTYGVVNSEFMSYRDGYAYTINGDEPLRTVITDTNVNIITTANMSTHIESTFTIEYTKTTDTASSPVAQIDIIGNNTISVSEAPGYSTEEILTTERWIDGKPIYRTVLSSNGSSNVTIPNASEIVNFRNKLEFTNANTGDKAYYYDNGRSIHDGNNKYYITSSNGIDEIAVTIWDDRWDYWEVIVEYTKTTDTAESPVAQISIPEKKDVYSEEETETNKVYLGKTVYRKVIISNETFSATKDNDYNFYSNETFEYDIVDINYSLYQDNGKVYTDSSSEMFYYNNDYKEAIVVGIAASKQLQLFVRFGDNRTFTKFVCVVEYTKN